MTKLLVASGFGFGEYASVEIVNLDGNHPDLKCDDLPNLPVEMYFWLVGQLFMGERPIICGGIRSENNDVCGCQVFENGSWNFTSNLKECQTNAASPVVKNSKRKDVLLIEGVNFTNILRKAFKHTDPKSAKRQSTQAAFCTFGICRRKSLA